MTLEMYDFRLIKILQDNINLAVYTTFLKL